MTSLQFYVESADPDVLRILLSDEAISASRVHDEKEQEEGGQKEFEEVDALEEMKENMGYKYLRLVKKRYCTHVTGVTARLGGRGRRRGCNRRTAVAPAVTQCVVSHRAGKRAGSEKSRYFDGLSVDGGVRLQG